MVIVVFHALASAILYLRDRFMGYTWNSSQDGNSERNTATNINCRKGFDFLQDAFAPILDASNLAELREAVHASIKQCLPGVERVQVFLKNPATERIEADSVVLPAHGVMWDAFHQSAPHICSIPSGPDPVIDILQLDSSDLCKVLLLPVSSKQSDSNLGIIVASLKSESLSVGEEKCLRFLVKQVCLAHTAVQQAHSPVHTDQLEPLMKLCGELHDQDAAALELKVIRYLREQTGAESGFLLLVVPETLELISQVVGDTVLPEEVRFPGLWSCFAQALETKLPMTLDHIPQERRGEVEKIVERKVNSFLCVPVARKGSEDLLALACLVNKIQEPSFSEMDIQIVQQCFKYTATVLTSTLAFQNERKLKNQTQALLQVARKLFTRLGECVREDPGTFKLSPFLFTVTRYVHSFLVRHVKKADELFTGYQQTTAKPVRKTTNLKPVFKHAFGSPTSDVKRKVTILDPPGKSHEEKSLKSSEASGGFVQNTGRCEGLGEADSSNLSSLSTQQPSTAGSAQKSLPVQQADGHHRSSQKSSLSTWSNSEEERKRKMSRNLFCMYDPISRDALSPGDEDDDNCLTGNPPKDCKSEDPVSVVPDPDQTAPQIVLASDSVLPSSQSFTDGQENIESDIPGSSKSISEDVQSGSQELLSRSSSTNYSQKNVTFDIPGSPRRASEDEGSGSQESLAKSSSFNRKVIITDLQTEQDLKPGCDNHTDGKQVQKQRKRGSLLPFEILRNKSLAVGAVYDFVPFDILRLVPLNSIAAVRTDDWATFDILRAHAPPDAGYSDGDFLYDLTKLLREIMQEARNLTDSERCSVFLLDQDSDELVATVFDGITTNNKEWQLRDGVQSEIRLPKTQGIAGHVATTGTLLNIKDAYSHPLFYRGIDDSTGFRTRNILCFPIKDEEGVVLGVAQLCNKKTGTYFTTFDEDIASAFAVYCCISISHSLMYKKVIDIQYRNSLANELMMFHMKCLIYKKLQDTQHRHKLANELLKFHMQQIPSEEVQELAVQGLPQVSVFHRDFDKFSYPPRTLAESRTTGACQAMFEDLGFVHRWRLKSDTLARFLLMVKKGYRNPPYHNWMHAFSVAHFGYLCIRNLKLANYLEDIEMFALFVSCLCHDIDHRGTTNSFQVKSQSVLAALYSSEGSVMERHHLAQSMCILNTEGSNIFENLSSKEYQQVLDLMRDIILATDVAHHLRIFDSLEEMAINGYNKDDPKCRNLLLCLLMTASDLSDQTKSWDNTKHIAVLIYQEFFSQGDLEKALGESPLEMMDRERACVPDLQISFLDNIAIPVYRVLAMIFPEAKQVEQCVQNNRKHWERKTQLLKLHNNSEQTMSVQEIIALGEGDNDDIDMKMDTNQHNGS